MRRSTIVLGALTLAGAGFSAPSASADTQATAYVYEGGNTVYFVAGDGEVNDVVIVEGPSGSTEFIIDDQVPVAAGDGCVHPDPGDETYVVCTFVPGPDNFYVYVNVDLGDLDDQLVLRAGDEGQVTGGYGDDILDGTDRDWLSGGYGDDVVRDALVAYGGPGDDTLSPVSLGEGGEGNDTITTEAGAAYGDEGDDVLLGGDGQNYFFGDAGADEIRGGRGPDELHGGEGDDTVYGNSGDDVIYGGPGVDQLSGGPGTDQLYQD